MKGRTPNKEEKAWMDKITALGCIVCYNDLNVYTEGSPHHIDGKTKPGAHLLTICLCGRHHQIPGEGYVSRHGDGKARFEKEYGLESKLLEITKYALSVTGFMEGL